MILKIPIVHPISEKFTGATTYSLFEYGYENRNYRQTKSM